jgi:hypothetical protein
LQAAKYSPRVSPSSSGALKKPGALNKTLKWIKKHKTPLAITGASIAVPAAVSIGLQTSAEVKQDKRDKALLESTSVINASFVFRW